MPGKRIQLYVREEDLALIDRHAKRLGVSRSHFMIAAATGAARNRDGSEYALATKKYVRDTIARAVRKHDAERHGQALNLGPEDEPDGT
jgi:hypothetical protein